MFLLVFVFLLYVIIPAAIILFIIYLVNPNLIYKVIAAIKNSFHNSEPINPTPTIEQKEIPKPENNIVSSDISAQAKNRQEKDNFSGYLKDIFRHSIPKLNGFLINDMSEIDTDDYIGCSSVTIFQNIENGPSFIKIPAIFTASYYNCDKQDPELNYEYIDSIIEKHGKQRSITLMQNGVKNILVYDERAEEDYEYVMCSSSYIQEIYDIAANSRPMDGWYFVPYDKYYNHLARNKLLQHHVLIDAQQYYFENDINYIKPSFFRLCGESYSDDKGTYLRPYAYSDYYRCTGNIIRNIYSDCLYNASNDEIEFWVPKYTFSSYEGYKRMLWNIYVPNAKDRAEQEIDCLVICEHGIFCIEVKNWSVPITCKDMEDKEWATAKNESHLSPIIQNSGHILGLKDLLREKGLDDTVDSLPIYNMVAFLDHERKPLFELGWSNMYKFYHEDHPDIFVGYDTDLERIICQFNSKSKILSKSQIDKIFDTLFNSCLRNDDEKNRILHQKKQEHEI